MPFKVTARTILQLGGELISSDGIAFYELIKNAFDAGSKKVLIDVVMRLPIETISSYLALLESVDPKNRKKIIDNTKQQIRQHADPTAKDIDVWLRSIDEAQDETALRSLLLQSNSITFTDFGHGMTLADLNDNYLTVGTPHRKQERTKSKNAGENKVILGEKGIGRLSTMRLGRHLFVKTASPTDTHWNVLEINWDAFGEEMGQLVEDIQVDPEQSQKVNDGERTGTIIRISHLNENWSYKKLTAIANNDIARLLDPFTRNRRISIPLKFNGQRVVVPQISEILTEKAHAILDAKFEVVERDSSVYDVSLTGTAQYLVSSATGQPLKNRTHGFKHSYDDLCGLFHDTEDIDLETCVSLGPFSLKCYWFNRRIIKKITVNEETLDLKALIRQWSGGLALYRDGFRVPPYGSPDDDWLDLDRVALASPGYKVNRAQLIGKVDITAAANPSLVDQTNREGLRDCRQKRILVALCNKVLVHELRGYLNEVDDEIRKQERISFGDLSERLSEVGGRINESLDNLDNVHRDNPTLGLGKIEQGLRSAYKIVLTVVDSMQASVEATEDEKGKLLHLAALGLAVEKLAHELNRTTRHALESLRSVGQGKGDSSLRETAEIQLISLQKRLQNLDPQLGPKRNRKEEFDLRDCLALAVDAYAGKAQRHNVELSLKFEDQRPIMVKTVKACILQVVQNLLDNSFYWLTAKRRKRDVVDSDRLISISVSAQRGRFEVYDNGPGVAPENKDKIFQEFFTLKKSGEGKGLGLYLARELMELYAGSIELSEDNVNENGRLTTFVVDFSGMKI